MLTTARYASYSRDANNRRDANNGGNTWNRKVFNNSKVAIASSHTKHVTDKQDIPGTSKTSNGSRPSKGRGL